MDPTEGAGRLYLRRRRFVHLSLPIKRRLALRGHCARLSAPYSTLSSHKEKLDDAIGVFESEIRPPLDQTRMLPLESPVRTSPLSAKAMQVTYLGLSRVSKRPSLREMDPFSSDQKQTWLLPQVTNQWRSIGWNSTPTTRSDEHLVSVILLPLSPFCQSHSDRL